MSQNTTADIADAVLALIEAEQELSDTRFTIAFTAARAELPEKAVEELTTTHLWIVGRKHRSEPTTRGGGRTVDHVIEMGLQKKLDPANRETQILALNELAEQIEDVLFETLVLPGRRECLVEFQSNVASDVSDHMEVVVREKAAYQTTLQATYRGARG